MKAVIQRVISASVAVEGKTISSIGKGLLVLVGIDRQDEPADATFIIRKILSAKVFDDETGLWKKNVKEIDGEVLCVSQFTLLATMSKGPKPDFHQSMSTEPSRAMYHAFLEEIGAAYHPDKIKNGQFGAMMQVSLTNDGPTTILLNSREKHSSASASASGTSTPGVADEEARKKAEYAAAKLAKKQEFERQAEKNRQAKAAKDAEWARRRQAQAQVAGGAEATHSGGREEAQKVEKSAEAEDLVRGVDGLSVDKYNQT